MILAVIKSLAVKWLTTIIMIMITIIIIIIIIPTTTTIIIFCPTCFGKILECQSQTH